jgi:hypothetical protein
MLLLGMRGCDCCGGGGAGGGGGFTLLDIAAAAVAMLSRFLLRFLDTAFETVLVDGKAPATDARWDARFGSGGGGGADCWLMVEKTTTTRWGLLSHCLWNTKDMGYGNP